jgi:hypothetical protein
LSRRSPIVETSALIQDKESLFSTIYDWNVDCVLRCTGGDVAEDPRC